MFALAVSSGVLICTPSDGNLTERTFAIIGLGSYEEVYKGFPAPAATPAETIKYYDSLPVGQKAVLQKNDLPWFVTFTDNNDPQTIKTVTEDSFSKFFGSGVFLNKVEIEITNDPVTWGRIDEALPWLEEKK